jgi:hypothetical protein
MATTAGDIISRAFSKIRILAVGQTMSDADNAHALVILNDMAEEWAGENLMLYHQTEESFPMVATQASYTIGEDSTPDFDTVRPQEILDSTFIRDGGNYDYPVKIISMGEYRRRRNKSTAGRPYQLAYNPTYPNGTIYLYFTPNSTESIYLTSLKELSTFAATTTELSLPKGYNNALILNLAIMLSPDYGKKVDVVLATLAGSAKGKIKRRSVQRQEPVRLEVARMKGDMGVGNINNYWE